MRRLNLLLVLNLATPAFATQTIDCHQIDRKGNEMTKGGTVHLQIEFLKDGTIDVDSSLVEVKGFTRKNRSSLLDSLKLLSVNQSRKESPREYTTIFFEEAEGMLDIQLQFDSKVIDESFTVREATFVIGSEDANPEYGFAYGYKMNCRSTKKPTSAP